MKNYFYILIFLFSHHLIASSEEVFNPKASISNEIVIDKRENYFINPTEARIAPKVSPISGEYYEEEIDYVVAGSEPLSIRRFYNHLAPNDARYGNWRFNPESFFAANFEWHAQDIFAAVGEADGTIHGFKNPTAPNFFDFDLKDGFTIAPTGQTHPLNIKIFYEKIVDPKDKKRYQYKGIISDGSGRKRHFLSPMHRWITYVHYTEKKHGFAWTWGDEKKYIVFPNTWTPYQVPIEEEKLPNGNIIAYTYTKWVDSWNYPKPPLLQTITAYNHDKTKVLGSLTFNYNRDKNGEVDRVRITGSDRREAVVQYTGKTPVIGCVKRPGSPSALYGYKGTFLNKIEKPDGRIFATGYEPGTNKVNAQYAPVGSNGELLPIAKYEYHDQSTSVIDAEGNVTIYRYDEAKRLAAVEKYQDSLLYSVEKSQWNPTNGNLEKKSIEDGFGNPLLIHEYEYDNNHNPIVKKVGDGKEWRTIRRTYSSDDGFNLKLTESDKEGREICYEYVPGTNLLASEFLYEDQKIRKRIFHIYDDCAICIKTIIDDGISTNPDDLQDVTFRKITEIVPKQKFPCFGLPEIIKEKTIDSNGQEILLKKVIYTYTPFGKILKEEHYDADENYRFSIINEYDQEERLVSTKDPEGNKTTFTYDNNYNLTAISGPKPDQHREITYDKVNRPICIADWQSDGQVLMTEKRYDALGRVIEEIDACKNSTRFEYDALGRPVAVYHPDGSVETKEYDVLGNVLKETDPEGFQTTKTYNSFGQALSVHYPDGSEEHFTYYPEGNLKTHADQNGCITRYTYDFFDRAIKSEIYAPNGKLLKTISTTWSTFNQLSETDGEGVTTTFEYDLAGRKICERKAYQKIDFAYDKLGHLAKIHEGDTTVEQEYDFLDHLIKSQTKKGSIVQAQEEYRYDESGNQTHTITSNGVTTTIYNTYGKPLSITDPAGNSTIFSYHFGSTFQESVVNPNGIQTITIQDTRGRVAQFLKKTSKGQVIQKYENEYDKNGNRIKLTHTVFSKDLPIRSITHSSNYGPMGRLEKFIESGEKETRYLYDDKGRLKTLIKPDGCHLNYEYDEIGRLARHYAHDFDYHYAYDRCDRILTVYDAISGKTTKRSYDPLGNILEETTANGLTLKSHFDNRGRRDALILPDSSKVDYKYEGIYLYKVVRDHYEHIYSKRNLEGQITQAHLPHNLGDVVIERDALGRYKNFSTPYYSAKYSKNAYDGNGNLLSYSFTDLQGKWEHSYTYDDLDQLISEKDHTYEFDSLCNRLKKDTMDYAINPMCQVTHDGKVEYTYDPCGNLISDDNWNYTYDSLDRLIAIENGGTFIEYTYDPFNRRLSKKVSGQWLERENKTYLWDGKNEIGSVDSWGNICELRILGEGLGAEIGAAVLYELNGKAYVPIHDHRGCLVSLIDPKKKKTVECYRYTAYGEELTDSDLSPWRFSSKRIERETGLVFFGRRYYQPILGRWITQDPEGFENGLNLYAYVSNSPLSRLDLYGLKEVLPINFGEHHSSFSNSFRLPGFFGLVPEFTPSAFDYSFRSLSAKPRIHDLSQLNRPELPGGRGIFFVNGMNNQQEEARGHMLHLSDLAGGCNISGVHIPDNGWPMNLMDCTLGLLGIPTRHVPYIHKMWDDFFDSAPEDMLALHFCTSEGAIITNLALMHYPEDRRNRIRVIGVAPGKYVSEELCHSVQHYAMEKWWHDFVPRIDFLARKKNAHTVQYIPRNSRDPWFAHSFSCKSYEQYVRRETRYYLKLTEK